MLCSNARYIMGHFRYESFRQSHALELTTKLKTNERKNIKNTKETNYTKNKCIQKDNTNRVWTAPWNKRKLQLHLFVKQLTTSLSTATQNHYSILTAVIQQIHTVLQSLDSEHKFSHSTELHETTANTITTLQINDGDELHCGSKNF